MDLLKLTLLTILYCIWFGLLRVEKSREERGGVREGKEKPEIEIKAEARKGIDGGDAGRKREEEEGYFWFSIFLVF